MKTEPKVIHENEFERTVEMVNQNGQIVPVKTFYFHCDHGFVAWQQRSVDPVAQIKCPYPGCERELVPGKAPKREGMTVQGHI
jgi:hypothetical protein